MAVSAPFAGAPSAVSSPDSSNKEGPSSIRASFFFLIAVSLEGILSQETILKMFPSYIVEDVKKEIAAIKKKKEARMLEGPSLFDESGEETADGAPANVAETAMNGAQVQALMGLATQIMETGMPIESAKGIMMVAFPAISEEEASRILTPLEAMRGTLKPEPKQFPPAQAGQGEGQEEEANGKA